MGGAPPVSFLGPRSKKPRLESQVFYASAEAKPDAVAAAKLLAPIIGPAAVQPWPGAGDYGVVVVVGSKVAAAPASVPAPAAAP